MCFTPKVWLDCGRGKKNEEEKTLVCETLVLCDLFVLWREKMMKTPVCRTPY